MRDNFFLLRKCLRNPFDETEIRMPWVILGNVAESNREVFVARWLIHRDKCAPRARTTGPGRPTLPNWSLRIVYGPFLPVWVPSTYISPPYENPIQIEMPAGISNWMTLDKRMPREGETRTSYFFQYVEELQKWVESDSHNAAQGASMCTTAVLNLCTDCGIAIESASSRGRFHRTDAERQRRRVIKVRGYEGCPPPSSGESRDD